jgi:hypothetical protein
MLPPIIIILSLDTIPSTCVNYAQFRSKYLFFESNAKRTLISLCDVANIAFLKAWPSFRFFKKNVLKSEL